MIRHQYGNSAFLQQMSFCRETSENLAVFTRLNVAVMLICVATANLHVSQFFEKNMTQDFRIS